MQSKKGKAAEKSPQEETSPGLPRAVPDLYQQITEHGDTVRKLKAAKASKVWVIRIIWVTIGPYISVCYFKLKFECT